MARIAGVNIPTNKRVEVALTYIHGIGDTFASQICEKVQIPAERRVRLLPGFTPSPRLAGPRSEDPHQCAHAQGSGQADRRQEKVGKLQELGPKLQLCSQRRFINSQMRE